MNWKDACILKQKYENLKIYTKNNKIILDVSPMTSSDAYKCLSELLKQYKKSKLFS